jgi:hypothetical protein
MSRTVLAPSTHPRMDEPVANLAGAMDSTPNAPLVGLADLIDRL